MVQVLTSICMVLEIALIIHLIKAGPYEQPGMEMNS